MVIKVDKTGTVEGFNNTLDSVAKNKSVKGFLILACDANDFTPDTVDEKLKEVTLPLLGGIFPAIIHEKEKLEKGTIVAGLSKEPNVPVELITVDGDVLKGFCEPSIIEVKTDSFLQFERVGFVRVIQTEPLIRASFAHK